MPTVTKHGKDLGGSLRASDREDHKAPNEAEIGHPIFAALIAAAWCARNLFGFEFAGLVLLLVFFVYPYYCVQLLMQWRMRRHQVWARRMGVSPTYAPSWPRGWAATYVGFFLMIAGSVVGIERLLGQ